MFAVFYTLLLLASGLQVVTAEVKHVNDGDKVEQVVSLLHGISQKLAAERKKEDIVYDEINRYCTAGDGTSQASAKSGNSQASAMSGIEKKLDQLKQASQAAQVQEADAVDKGLPKAEPARAPEVTKDQVAVSHDAEEGDHDAPSQDAGADDATKQMALSPDSVAADSDPLDSAQERLSLFAITDDVPVSVHQQKKDEPVAMTKAETKQIEKDDSASDDQLANIVKAAVEPLGKNAISSDVVQSDTASIEDLVKKSDSALSSEEPLASEILSNDDPGFGDAVFSAAPIQQVPERSPVLVKRSLVEQPETQAKQELAKSQDTDAARAKPAPVAVAVAVADAARSEFAATANEVTNLEKEFDPPVSKAQQQADVATMSAAIIDLGGALPAETNDPSIDQQALQFYNGFGGEGEGEPSASDTMGSLAASPAFLQVTQHHHHQLSAKLAPVVREDLDAAFVALKAIAEDTQSAMSIMSMLSKAGDVDPTPDTSSDLLHGECDSLMQKFKQRQAVRAKQEAELETRSQQLLQSLHPTMEETFPVPTKLLQKAHKHLRSHQ